MRDHRAAALAPATARRRYLAAGAACTLCMTLAFMQVLPKPAALSSEVSASRILELALVGAALAIALPMWRGGGPPAPTIGRTSFCLLAGFAAWAFVSAAWSPLPMTSGAKALELAAITIAAYRVAAAAPGDGAARRDAVADAATLGIVLAVLALIGANLVHVGAPLPLHIDELDSFANTGRPRLMLGYNHALSSAALLAFGIVFALNSTLHALPKTALVAALGLMLWLCDARGTSAALPFGVALSLFLRARPSLLRAWLGAAAGFAGLAGLVMLLTLGDVGALLTRAFGEDVGSLNSRSGLWAYALEVSWQHPLGGVGYFGTRVQLLAAFPFAGHAHNTFLEVLMSTGLPGAALTLGFGLACAVVLLRGADPLLAGLLPVVLVEGNLNPLLFVPAVPMFLFALAMFGAIAAERRPAARPALAAARPAPPALRLSPRPAR